MSDSLEAQKRAAALAAAEEVRADMVVGLGTGTTAFHLIEALGARAREGLAIRCVATSLATEAHARAVGLAVLDMGDVATVDLAIDGVDEIDPDLRAIKGGGGAMLREKVVAAAATRMIAIADAGKPVAQLGRALPIEVLPFARGSVEARVERLGALPAVRTARSDQGNLLIDCAFGPIDDPEALAAALQAIPGLLGHGLFLSEIDAFYMGTDDGVIRRERAPSFKSD